MQFLDKPSLFIKGLPCVVVVYGEQGALNNKVCYIRQSHEYMDAEVLVKRVKDKMALSKRGVVVDLRKLESCRNAKFVVNYVAKHCWECPLQYKTTKMNGLVEKKLVFLGDKKFKKYFTHCVEYSNFARELTCAPSNRDRKTESPDMFPSRYLKSPVSVRMVPVIRVKF